MSGSRPFGRSARWLALPVGLLLLVTGAGVALAEETVLPVTELLESAEQFADAVVLVEGELVGDYGFRRDGFMWTQLNDDSYARTAVVDDGALTGSNTGIGVRMPDSLADGLDPPGGYRIEGPLVRLTGVWHHHDPERGGESYLDVTALTVIEEGRRLEEGPDWVVFMAGIALLSLAGFLRLRNRGAEFDETD